MDRADRTRARQLLGHLTELSAKAARVRDRQDDVRVGAQAAVDRLDASAVVVQRRGRAVWRVIPLSPSDVDTARRLDQQARLPRWSAEETDAVRRLSEELIELRPLVLAATGARRWFAGRERRRAGEQACGRLLELADLVHQRDLVGALDRLATALPPLFDRDGPRLDDLLDPRLGMRAALTGGAQAVLLDQTEFGELPRALAELAAVVDEERPYRDAVRAAADRIRRPTVATRLANTPITQLDEVSTARLRTDLLLDHGWTTVADVRGLDAARLCAVNGVGPRTAEGIVEAVRTLEEIAAEEAVIRLDPEAPSTDGTALVAALGALDRVRRTAGAREDLELAADLMVLRHVVAEPVSHLLVMPAMSQQSAGSAVRLDLRVAIATVLRRADLIAERQSSPCPPSPTAPTDLWSDFHDRPAAYQALLAEEVDGARGAVASAGDLPAGLVDTVRDQQLRTDHLRVTLRDYQAFAARFALVQRKVILGDEMGLGKTIEALAVLAHLWATGARHLLVVCPAGVLTNWIRETERHTGVPVHRLHGAARELATTAWIDQGGIAVTTFSTLGWHERSLSGVARLDCVVVDEAHYVKNPETWRARATRSQLDRSDRALLMTGTPIENRVEDFTALVSYLRPDLLPVLRPDGATLPARLFRREVAPIYLRRNAEDVLTELPDRIDVDEWLPMSEADLALYAAAVDAGSFAAMRRAAMLAGAASAKVRRLIDLVAEAEENERRVVVFTYFRDVLEVLAAELPKRIGGRLHGPLTGDVPAARRQQIIDEFSTAEHGAVLLSQISTGGVGVNIQAASVVVLCEPQLKPTTEDQAIARAHRMGQLRTVQVHRLLSEDAVDERIRESLADKRRIFDDFVRDSVTADAVPEARQIGQAADREADTEAELGARIVAVEQRRLLYAPPETSVPDD